MFHTATRASKAIEGHKSLPGIAQAISNGIKSLTVNSNSGVCTMNLTNGFISANPRYIATSVNNRSIILRKTKESFSAVHLLNVAEESHQLVAVELSRNNLNYHKLNSNYVTS